jgi:hypothetical protein
MCPQEWLDLYFKERLFDFRERLAKSENPHSRQTYHRLRMCVQMGLNRLTKESRRAAWLLMLGIEVKSLEMDNYNDLYHMLLRE